MFQADTDILKRGGDHTIQYFKIRNSKIPRLADHIFMGMKIEHLYIHNCGKYSNAFQTKLRLYIFLDKKLGILFSFLCFISFLETQSLDTASISSQGGVLSHLVLSKNQLKDVPTRALRMMKNLDHLNLNDNQITSLHANAFEGLSKVIFS